MADFCVVLAQPAANKKRIAVVILAKLILI
jgi:hypothetical protein